MAGGLRRVSPRVSGRVRRQLPALARWPRGWHGRLGAQIGLAAIAAVAAFTVTAAIGTAARYHVPVPVFSLVMLLFVLAVARFAGVLYALPVGVVTILAFDWYFLPPLRQLNGATVLVLGLFLVMSVVVGAFATLASRRAAASEAARGVLADEQAALRRVATLVAEGASTAEVFAAVADKVSEVMHLPVAAIQRYDEDGETMTMLAASSDRPHPFQPGTRWPLHHSGLAGQVQRTGRAARAQDYTDRRGSFAVVARELGLESVAGAPIIVNGAVWGLVTIASTDAPLPDDTEDRLVEFTELLGTAIANTQSRAELSASRARIVTAADETRRQLERDLHDGIQQRLVSLALKARTIETMTPRPAGEIQGELSVLAQDLVTSLDELREISRGIHPAVLSEAGLGPALRALARRSAVPVVLDLNLCSRLAEHVEVAGYYIASEALTNAAKHAQASVVDVRADGGDGALILSIRDDGIGGADPSQGSGIIGLKDRVEALGGTISVLSPAGCGTTLDVQLPASPAASRPAGQP